MPDPQPAPPTILGVAAARITALCSDRPVRRSIRIPFRLGERRVYADHHVAFPSIACHFNVWRHLDTKGSEADGRVDQANEVAEWWRSGLLPAVPVIAKLLRNLNL